MYIVSLNF